MIFIKCQSNKHYLTIETLLIIFTSLEYKTTFHIPYTHLGNTASNTEQTIFVKSCDFDPSGNFKATIVHLITLKITKYESKF